MGTVRGWGMRPLGEPKGLVKPMDAILGCELEPSKKLPGVVVGLFGWFGCGLGFP